jgi:hypothetical protein
MAPILEAAPQNEKACSGAFTGARFEGVWPENIHASKDTGDAVGAEAFWCRSTCLIVVIWGGWSSHHMTEVNSVEGEQHLFYLQRPIIGKPV